MDDAKERSKFDPDLPEFSAWMDEWMGQDFKGWAHHQHQLVDTIGKREAERIAKERATPCVQEIMDRAKEALSAKISRLEGDVGAEESSPVAPSPPSSTASGTPSQETERDPGLKTCPECAEEVRTAARKCRFCGFRFDENPDD